MEILFTIIVAAVIFAGLIALQGAALGLLWRDDAAFSAWKAENDDKLKTP